MLYGSGSLNRWLAKILMGSLLCCASHTWAAQEAKSVSGANLNLENKNTSTTKRKILKKSQAIFLKTLSWTENLEADNGTSTEKGNATFAATALTWSQEDLLLKNSNLDLGIFSATASGLVTASFTGGLSYSQFKVASFGVYTSLQQKWNLSPSIALSLGLGGLFRSITWPAATSATNSNITIKAVSGSPVNAFLEAQLNTQLSNNWVLHQSFGGLFLNARTLWSLGLGYRW
jgi:hypothetical protein